MNSFKAILCRLKVKRSKSFCHRSSAMDDLRHELCTRRPQELGGTLLEESKLEELSWRVTHCAACSKKILKFWKALEQFARAGFVIYTKEEEDGWASDFRSGRGSFCRRFDCSICLANFFFSAAICAPAFTFQAPEVCWGLWSKGFC